jgi:hypothetical protein
MVFGVRWLDRLLALAPDAGIGVINLPGFHFALSCRTQKRRRAAALQTNSPFTRELMNEWEWQLLEDKTLLEHVVVSGVELKQGDRVRLKPRVGGDIFDLALSGKVAVVEAIEQDYEGNAHLAVVVDDDPGRDLGMLRQPGHRFFFSPDEVEPLGGK